MADFRRSIPWTPIVTSLLILTIFITSVALGFAGVDFGHQWDQNYMKGYANQLIRTGNLLPGQYIYPPVGLYIASSTVIPYAAPFVLRYGSNWTPTQTYLLEEVLHNNNHSFLLNLRRVFVLFTMLAVIWVGWAAAQKHWMAGLVAAAAIGFSWEVNYQSRIVHPDGPTMQFVALTLLLAMLAVYRKRPFQPRTWLLLASAASAVATATKYTAGISLVFALAVAGWLLYIEKAKFKTVAGTLLTMLAIYIAVFFLLVPGALLETSFFMRQLIYAQDTYNGLYGPYSIASAGGYLKAIGLYLSQAAFSYNRVLALIVPALGLVGAYSLVFSKERREKGLGLALAAIPLAYCVFLASHHLLYVRNLLMVLPFIAILAGYGFVWLWQVLVQQRVLRLALPAILLGLAAFNVWWLYTTAISIQNREDMDLFAQQALDAIARSGDPVYVTPAALNLLNGRELPSIVSTHFTGAEDLVLFAYRADALDEHEGGWPINFPGASPLIFGPRELNMDWYASWPSGERLVLGSPVQATQDGGRLSTSPQLDPASTPPQSQEGVLRLDGEQFYVEQTDGKRLDLLNSANPQVILAARPLIDTRVQVTGVPYSENRKDSWYLLALNGEPVLAASQAKVEQTYNRIYAALSPEAKNCLQNLLGDFQMGALLETSVDLVELDDATLLAASACMQ